MKNAMPSYDSFKNKFNAVSGIIDKIRSFIIVCEIETGEIIFSNSAFWGTFSDGLGNKTCFEIGNDYSENDKFSLLNSVLNKGIGNSEIYLEEFEQFFMVDAEYIRWTDNRKVRLVEIRAHFMQKKHEEELERLAYTDQLTKLPNRYRCHLDLDKAIEEAKRTKETGYFVFLDIDDFKNINDSYGHDYGDAVLVEFAQFLESEVAEVGHVYRFGGDEFALLLATHSEKALLQVLDNILDRSKKLWNAGDKQFYSTASLGVVRFPDEQSDVKEIIKNADIAMYQAKNTGKNKYYIFSDEIENNSVRRVEMEKMLRASIKNNFKGFEVYYQPVFEMPNKRVIGAEALLRWFDETGNMVLPDRFIALAEYLGLIVPLGNLVLRQAAEFCKEMNNNGFADFSVSINISIKQFQRHDFAKTVSDILRDVGVDRRNIVLEVTEGVAIADLQRTRSTIKEMQQSGVCFAIDDFGAGYSSLNNLRQLPVDIIKIDRAFIRDIAVDPYAESFIHMITDLGHSIDKQICIEGVETKEQLSYCLKIGVDLIQGYYFAEPLPKERMIKMANLRMDRVKDFLTVQLPE